MKRSILITTISIFLIAGLAIFLVFNAQEKSKPSTEIEPKGPTGLEIAQKTLSFVEETRDETGEMAYYIQCQSTGQCEDFGTEFATTANLLSVAYMGLYEASKNMEFLDKSEAALDEALNICSPQGLCGISVFDSLFKFYQTEKNEKHKQNLIESKEKWIDFRELDGDTPIIAVSKLAMIYSIDRNPETLQTAKDIFKELKSPLGAQVDKSNFEIPSSNIRRYDCLIQNTNIDFYLITKENKYLQEAKDFFDKNDIGSQVQYFEETRVVADCASALLSLYEVTGNDDYKNNAIQLVDHVIMNTWDSKEKPIIAGDYGFVISSAAILEKNVEDSLRMVPILTRLKDTYFSHPRL